MLSPGASMMLVEVAACADDAFAQVALHAIWDLLDDSRSLTN